MTEAKPYIVPSLPASGDPFQHIHDTLRAHARPDEGAGGYTCALIKSATRTAGRRQAGMEQAEGCLEAIRVLRVEASHRDPKTLSAAYVGPVADNPANWAGFEKALTDLEASVRRWFPSAASAFDASRADGPPPRRPRP